MTLNDLELAFDYVSSDSEFGEVSVYLSKSTGEVVYNDEPYSGEPCPVEDIEDHPDYIPIPTKHELDLGTQLVWQFVDKEIPALYPKVREIFSRKGAYGRFKDFLSYNGILEQWFDFESSQTRVALTEWCKENKVPLSLDNKSEE